MSDAITIEGLDFSYAPHRPKVFQDFTLRVRAGEVVVLVGPSASGKSTLLHLVADHLVATKGRVERSGPCLVIYQRDALLPWLTVRENLEFAKTYALRAAPGETDSIIGSFHLSDAMDLFPRELSGGLRQRAEVARALVAGADILLMDEPFSALDAMTRNDVREETFRLLKRRGTTVLLVTHDLVEAAQVGDRVILLESNPCRIHDDLALLGDSPRPLASEDFLAGFSRLNHLAKGVGAPKTSPSSVTGSQ
jgi:ABC-type nitrate/sulfonate/bicarbonate transport system ATPase subunit